VIAALSNMFLLSQMATTFSALERDSASEALRALSTAGSSARNADDIASKFESSDRLFILQTKKKKKKKEEEEE
jgi:hypothetical protein